MTQNLNAAVTELYNHFVGHEFTRNKSYETKLRERVKNQLDQLQLDRPFISKEISDKFGANVRFELARREKPDTTLSQSNRLEAVIPFTQPIPSVAIYSVHGN